MVYTEYNTSQMRNRFRMKESLIEIPHWVILPRRNNSVQLQLVVGKNIRKTVDLEVMTELNRSGLDLQLEAVETIMNGDWQFCRNWRLTSEMEGWLEGKATFMNALVGITANATTDECYWVRSFVINETLENRTADVVIRKIRTWNLMRVLQHERSKMSDIERQVWQMNNNIWSYFYKEPRIKKDKRYRIISDML